MSNTSECHPASATASESPSRRSGHETSPAGANINVNIKRAALERLKDDIDQVLAESKLLNNEATMADAEQERVEVDADVLRFLGVTGHVYLGIEEEDQP